jgi:2-oxoglutarate dehydrogenase E2 component (dihydrolipoamide succinyltransferase)
MAQVQMVMPKMGESIMEGTILNWLKKVGDRIEQDESILEVATDKVDTEVPSTHAGVILEILAKEGEVVPIGKAILVIETGGDGAALAVPSNGQAASSTPAPVQTPVAVAVTPVELGKSSDSDRFYSPLVRNIAKEEGISLSELDTISGSGKDNRVTKTDLLEFIDSRKKTGIPSISTPSAPSVSASAPVVAARSISGDVDIIEMDRMRKMIAQRMVESKRISPHVTSFVEADVTNLAIWRNKMKGEFQKKFNQALTFTPIFLEAVIKALRDYPMMNISVDGDRIIVKKDINLGMAVALPNGNLIVPNIKRADTYNLLGLTEKVNDLANRARENKLTPDDLADGTYTVSNVGSFGNVMGTPIIMQPQVGILALGAVRKKPAVIETPQGDSIGVRQMMFLSHSYDHRVVDGSLGGMFVRRVADYLEAFDIDRKL